MAKYGAGKYSKRGKSSKGRKSMSKSVKPSKSFTKAVQKVIHKDAEDKMAFITSGNTPIYFNSGITFSSDCQAVLPQINNGNTDATRVGDELRAKKISLRGYISLGNDTSTQWSMKRVGVRVMVVSPKRFPNIDDAIANFGSWYTALLKKGATQTAFNGYISDLFTPINTDEITKYFDKVYYLSQDQIFTNIGSTTPTITSNQGIRETIKFFNIKIPCRNRKLRYDAGASANLQPTNFGPILLVGYAHLDGSSPDTATTQISMVYDTSFSYEDM